MRAALVAFIPASKVCWRLGSRCGQQRTRGATTGNWPTAAPTEAQLPTADQLLASLASSAPTPHRLELPLLIIDPMLPGQRLRFKSEDRRLAPLLQQGTEVAVIGLSGLTGRPLRRGVTATLQSIGVGEWELSGRRLARFRQAQLDAGEEPPEVACPLVEAELLQDEVKPEDVTLARTLPPSVEEWCSHVDGSRFEAFPGHVKSVLEDLGPMPPPEAAGLLALWVVALVNPLPALGVAMELRPSVLEAESVAERLQIASEGIRESIGHVSGRSPLF